MNCIFVCVFNNKSFVDMCYLFLESIFIYGQLDETTDIVVYTTTEFMHMIKQSHLFNSNIFFEINDTYTTIADACKAKLDVFNLQSTMKYDKILYLDIDVLVKGDINTVFKVAKDDLLYALEEGMIVSEVDAWGSSLIGIDEMPYFIGKTAFTSGIMLFKNCDKMKELFKIINEDVIKRHHFFHDQPHIVYNALKYNVYDNQALKAVAVNNDHNIHSDKVIHHFPGGPGIYQHKVVTMTIFLNNSKDYTISGNILRAKEYINTHLLPIINECGELLEGNIFMLHNTTDYTDIFLGKTKNISNVVLNTNIKTVMEIGFNAGFSTLLMLLSNPHIKITCLDLGDHLYALPCYVKLKETFGDRLNLIIGDSAVTLPRINTIYDLIHIDGAHTTSIAESDIVHSYRLSKTGTILIMDDYDFPNLHQLWDQYINTYKLQPLNISGCVTPYHDIRQVVK
jgi:hypothetical protein